MAFTEEKSPFWQSKLTRRKASAVLFPALFSWLTLTLTHFFLPASYFLIVAAALAVLMSAASTLLYACKAAVTRIEIREIPVLNLLTTWLPGMVLLFLFPALGWPAITGFMIPVLALCMLAGFEGAYFFIRRRTKNQLKTEAQRTD